MTTATKATQLNDSLVKLRKEETKVLSELSDAMRGENELRPGLVQWTRAGDSTYFAIGDTLNTVPSGWYTPEALDGIGYALVAMPLAIGELIKLPYPEYNAVITDFKKFWESEQAYRDYKFAYKRGVMLTGRPGCHAKDTEILMYDGSIKKVQDVIVGDVLMGDDSTPRKVLDLARGSEIMYKITPTKGDSFVVNANHILSLQWSGNGGVVNTTVLNYIKHGTERLKLRRTNIHFTKKDLKIPPYILGLWLGDGSSDGPELTSMDNEIVCEWENYGKLLGLTMTESRKPNNKAATFYLSTKDENGYYNSRKQNPLTSRFLYYNLLENKHIPFDYLTTTEKDRLELLAGLMDTDGHGNESNYEIATVHKSLRDEITYLCRSLGFYVNCTTYEAGTMVQQGKTYNTKETYRLLISGELHKVPVRLERKRAKIRRQVKNVLYTGFTYEEQGVGDYYGFALDGNHLYLTSDFTIHHNTGKSGLVRLICEDLIKTQNGIVINVQTGSNLYNLRNCFNMLRKLEPDRKVVCVMEDFDNLMNYDTGLLLNILDGNMLFDNIAFLATTNYPERILESVMNRPSRFDRRYEIGAPDENCRRVYLTKKFPKIASLDVDKIVKETAGFTIDFLKELSLSVYVLGYDMDKTLKEMKELFKFNGNVGR